MTTENTPEEIASVEDEPIDTGVGGKQRKATISPALKIAMILGLGGSAIGAALFISGSQMTEGTQVVAPPQMDSTPGGSGQADSPEYREFLRSENERRAALARELGATSMPTPEVILQPRPQVSQVEEIPDVARREVEPTPARQVQTTTRRILPSPEPAPEQQRVETQEPTPEPQAQQASATPQNGGGEEPEENMFTTDMVRQMGAVTARWSPMGLRNADLGGSAADRAGAPNGAQAPDPQAGAGGAGAEGAGEQTTILRPGDILYGEMLLTVDSDSQSPVLVEIVTGDYKGARLVGEFTSDRRAEALVVTFNSITFPDGDTSNIAAFAVDARSAQTAVASDVERRYVRRYAPILGATFLSSYADAMSQPEQTIIGSGENREVITGNRTTRQSLFSGLSAAAGVISQDIMQGVPVGPRIVLRSGYPVAVLIIEPVEIPSQASAASQGGTPLSSSPISFEGQR